MPEELVDWMAFGVQTVINADDPPKGTSVIAKHFSPSIPEPTPINEIRQKTSDVTKSSLEVLCQDAITAQEEAQGDTGKMTREVVVPKETSEKEATPEEVEDKALEIAGELEQEISKGKVELETQGSKIVIRIRENGSFRAGSALFISHHDCIAFGVSRLLHEYWVFRQGSEFSFSTAFWQAHGNWCVNCCWACVFYFKFSDRFDHDVWGLFAASHFYS